MRDFVVPAQSIPHSIKLSRLYISPGQPWSGNHLLIENTSSEIQQEGLETLDTMSRS